MTLFSGDGPLVSAVNAYLKRGWRRFHMPGHAGRVLFPQDAMASDLLYACDLTELDGLDVLSEPTGCILEAQAFAAKTFGAASSYFLVNGATVGLMASLLCLGGKGKRVLLTRNVHRSVVSALILSGADPVWLDPSWMEDWALWGPVTPDALLDSLSKQADISALVLTSPTYEGLATDIQPIAEICRQRDIRLVVDEAHGALFPFSRYLPNSAISAQGVDVVVQSLHKTAGSLTQTAIAHLPFGSRLDADDFQQALNVLQTTSPSYPLMMSLDATCHHLASEVGQARVAQWVQMMRNLHERLAPQLKVLKRFEPPATMTPLWDFTRLYLRHPAIAGEDWGPWLEQTQGISFEQVTPFGVLYLSGMGTTEADVAVLAECLMQADARWLQENPQWGQRSLAKAPCAFCLPEKVLTPRDAFLAPGETLPPEACLGRIAKQMVVHCPPGIPILMPGERILPEHLPLLPSKIRVVL
ncbi:MAG: aminotransferase class I/II-fold pyridoxal phosphate-dependent enzyme [Candidatus Melainabacteria bacterium]|nr:aminotransferase class I/II-fold pyridoxal phosphate-dependent enzyme [Candidatus Melainabacteria bacterium]